VGSASSPLENIILGILVGALVETSSPAGEGPQTRGVDLLVDRQLLESLEVAEKRLAVTDFHRVRPAQFLAMLG
jgi:hypothetical protein